MRVSAPALKSNGAKTVEEESQVLTGGGPRLVVMWLQNTMAVRDKYSNRYDRSSEQSTITKKDVTANRSTDTNLKSRPECCP